MKEVKKFNAPLRSSYSLQTVSSGLMWRSVEIELRSVSLSCQLCLPVNLPLLVSLDVMAERPVSEGSQM